MKNLKAEAKPRAGWHHTWVRERGVLGTAILPSPTAKQEAASSAFSASLTPLQLFSVYGVGFGVPVEARREQQISLQLELQVVVNDQFQGLGTEPQCLEERQRTLIHGTISPTPHGLRQSLTMSLKLIQTPDPPASGSEVLRAEIIGVGLNRFSVKMQNNRRVRQSGEGRWALEELVIHSFTHPSACIPNTVITPVHQASGHGLQKLSGRTPKGRGSGLPHHVWGLCLQWETDMC